MTRIVKRNLNTGLRIQFVLCVAMGILLCCIFSVKLLSRIHDVQGIQTIDHDSSSRERVPPDPPDPVPKHVRELLEATKAATRAAAGGQEPPIMTQEERENWTLSHPCRSRVELGSLYARRKDVRDVANNPLWDMVLQEYAQLHRTCMQSLSVGDLRAQFLERNTSSGCKFAIADIDWGIPAGLSNRILTITSVVLYSILTQRVVLVPRSNLLTTLMCEPFFGSSWELDSYGPFSFHPWSEEAKDIWMFHKDVYEELDSGMLNHTATYLSSPQSNFFAASMRLSQYHPDDRFFCDTEQASFAGVTWLYFTGCIYTIPKFFAVPSFRRTLDALFPGRFVVTQMLRSIMLPGDSVWEQVIESEKTHFKSAEYRVGIQIRYYYGKAHYEEMNDIFNQRIVTCGAENGIFTPSTPQLGNLVDQKSVQVFVASLYTGFYDHMTKVYLALGQNVTLIQLSNNWVQTFGVGVDTQSLVEIFLLSFSDTLISTPISTFGGLAQAYGSLTPWKIETRKGDDLPPCERDTTLDLCYQTAKMRYSCPYNNVNGLHISDLAPYYQTCLKDFVQAGVQLVTDHDRARFQRPGIENLHIGLDQVLEAST